MAYGDTFNKGDTARVSKAGVGSSGGVGWESPHMDHLEGKLVTVENSVDLPGMRWDAYHCSIDGEMQYDRGGDLIPFIPQWLTLYATSPLAVEEEKPKVEPRWADAVSALDMISTAHRELADFYDVLSDALAGKQ